jgi:cation:H+ antiporter
MIESLTYLAIGLVALLVGGEVLVRGAVQLASRAGVTPLIVGLVIVGFGTSMPELVTSVEAALLDAPGIAWGNIVGSNIANALLILGVAALASPIIIHNANYLRDPVIMIAASFGLVAVALTGLGHALVGVTMAGLLAAYISYCYRQERVAVLQNPAEHDTEFHNAPHDKAAALELADPLLPHPLSYGAGNGWLKPIVRTLAGLAILIIGGRMLVSGAIDLARMADLSETLIGLTIVAVGTSLPELVTSVIAAVRKQSEIAFGNVIGSNIYNILGIGGVTMIFAPSGVPDELISRDLPIMLASSILIILILMKWREFGRISGATLVTCYFLYLGFLIYGNMGNG